MPSGSCSSLHYFWLFKNQSTGNSLAVQSLGLRASAARVRSLVGELRFCKPRGVAKKKKKKGPVNPLPQVHWDLKSRERGCLLLGSGKMTVSSRGRTLCAYRPTAPSPPPQVQGWLSAQMMPPPWGLPWPSHCKWVSAPLFFSTLPCWNPVWQLWPLVMTYLFARLVRAVFPTNL